MHWADKSVQDLNYKYFNYFLWRWPLLRQLDLGLQGRQPVTQLELEIWALGRGTIECLVKGDVTMTN